MDHTGHKSAAMVRVYTRRGDAFADHAGEVAFELVRLEGPPGEPEAAYEAWFWDDYHRRYAAFRNAYQKRRHAKRLPAPRPAPTPDRTCEVCDSSLKSFRADARTCSNACRQQAYRERKDAA